MNLNLLRSSAWIHPEGFKFMFKSKFKYTLARRVEALFGIADLHFD
jgi:hypothetical protein